MNPFNYMLRHYTLCRYVSYISKQTSVGQRTNPLDSFNSVSLQRFIKNLNQTYTIISPTLLHDLTTCLFSYDAQNVVSPRTMYYVLTLTVNAEELKESQQDFTGMINNIICYYEQTIYHGTTEDIICLAHLLKQDIIYRGYKTQRSCLINLQHDKQEMLQQSFYFLLSHYMTTKTLCSFVDVLLRDITQRLKHSKATQRVLFEGLTLALNTSLFQHTQEIETILKMSIVYSKQFTAIHLYEIIMTMKFMNDIQNSIIQQTKTVILDSMINAMMASYEVNLSQYITDHPTNELSVIPHHVPNELSPKMITHMLIDSLSLSQHIDILETVCLSHPIIAKDICKKSFVYLEKDYQQGRHFQPHILLMLLCCKAKLNMMTYPTGILGALLQIKCQYFDLMELCLCFEHLEKGGIQSSSLIERMELYLYLALKKTTKLIQLSNKDFLRVIHFAAHTRIRRRGLFRLLSEGLHVPILTPQIEKLIHTNKVSLDAQDLIRNLRLSRLITLSNDQLLFLYYAWGINKLVDQEFFDNIALILSNKGLDKKVKKKSIFLAITSCATLAYRNQHLNQYFEKQISQVDIEQLTVFEMLRLQEAATTLGIKFPEITTKLQTIFPSKERSRQQFSYGGLSHYHPIVHRRQCVRTRKLDW